jgi:hypothetical protein
MGRLKERVEAMEAQFSAMEAQLAAQVKARQAAEQQHMVAPGRPYQQLKNKAPFLIHISLHNKRIYTS